MDHQRELNIYTQDGGNSVVNVNPERVDLLFERPLLGRDTPPCPFAIAARRERLALLHMERVDRTQQSRSRHWNRHWWLLVTMLVCAAISGTIVVEGWAGSRWPAVAVFCAAYLAVAAGALRELARNTALFPPPARPPELDEPQRSADV